MYVCMFIFPLTQYFLQQVNQWTPFKVQLVHVYMFMLHVHELLKRAPANFMQQLTLKGLSSWII